jgi:hypothetical protein
VNKVIKLAKLITCGELKLANLKAQLANSGGLSWTSRVLHKDKITNNWKKSWILKIYEKRSNTL